MIHIQHDHGGRLGITADELIGEGLRHTLQRPLRRRVFQGRSTLLKRGTRSEPRPAWEVPV
jgi:hypothetical protein